MALVQQLDRTVHTTSSGIEITRLFYVKPYAFHTNVIQLLQGSVKDGVRLAPLRDPYIRNCYCNECVTTFADPRVNAGADVLEKGEGAGGLENELEVLSEPLPNTAGAYVTAHYRPLITAFPTSDPNGEQWDWIDPIFKPGVRQIPWPPGLNITREGGGQLAGFGSKGVPDALKQPLPIPVSDFSIRRILVGKPPWELFGAVPGTVNNSTFPTPGSKAAELLPAFAPRTLRMETPEVKNMIDASGNRWFEIVLHFTWIMHTSKFLIGTDGVLSEGPVTWNHIFMNPSFLLGISGRTAWYEVYRSKPRDVPPFGGLFEFGIPSFALKEGLLYTESDFMQLFEL